MNEQELRHALRGAMTATQPPPPMTSATVLDTARRARRRRRATLAGTASAGAVVLIAVGAIVVAGVAGNGPSPITAGGPGAVPTDRPGTAPGDPSNTKPSWPDGQTDRTASQGPRYDRGVQLLDLLTTSVPAGMTSPTDLKAVDSTQFYGDLRSHQAQFAEENGGRQVWEYLVSIPVGANGKWGKLLVEVHTAGNTVTGEGCALTKTFWGIGRGDCELVTVGDKQVGVAVQQTGDNQFDQWASYRHADGTVVYAAQAKSYYLSGLPGLAELPLTPQQLAALVVDPKFHLD